MQINRRVIGVVAVTATLVTLFLAVCNSLATHTRPKEMTNSAMTETEVRLGIYLENNNTLPKSLEVLPIRAGYANRTADGWGRPLIYETNENGFIVTLQPSEVDVG
jgi:hypothetical protein